MLKILPTRLHMHVNIVNHPHTFTNQQYQRSQIGYISINVELFINMTDQQLAQYW